MLKLSDNPPALPAGLTRPGEAPGTWWVAHTKPRSEKALAHDLNARHVNYYLPMATRKQMSGGRMRTTLIPLFPSYLFFAGSEGDRIKVLSTGRIVHTLPVPQQKMLVDELDAVHQVLSNGGDLAVYPHVAVGKRCRVARGPMRGVEGVVLQDSNISRIVLSVSIIGRGASLEISAADLEEAA